MNNILNYNKIKNVINFLIKYLYIISSKFELKISIKKNNHLYIFIRFYGLSTYELIMWNFILNFQYLHIKRTFFFFF